MFSDGQHLWLDRIRAHLTQNLSIDQDDVDTIPLLPGPARFVVDINAAMAA